MLIHLGDVEGMRIISRLLQIVRYIWCVGNNDFFESAWRRRIHGRGISYIYNADTQIIISMGETRLKQEQEGEERILKPMYGHTHRPFYEKRKKGLLH